MTAELRQDTSQRRRGVFLSALFFIPLLLSFLNYVSFHQYPILSADVVLVIAAFLALTLIMLALSHSRRLIFVVIAASSLSVVILLNDVFPLDTVNRLIEHATALVGVTFRIPGKVYVALLLVVSLVLIGRFSASRHFQTLIGLLLIGMLAAAAVQWSTRGVETDQLVPVKMERGAPAAPDTKAASDAPTLFLHIVLDEHQGIGQFPEDLAEAQRAKDAALGFYERFGFVVLPRTVVRHLDTEYSLSDLLNFDRTEDHLARLDGIVSIAAHHGGLRRTLLRNTAFDRLRERGYRLNVIQSNHLNLCATQWAGMTCREYQWNTIRTMLDARIPATTRAMVLTSMWLKTVPIAAWLMNQLQQHTYIDTLFIPPVAPMNEAILASTLDEIKSSGGHAAYFLHLMSPHHPFSYTDACTFDPAPWNWHGDRQQDLARLNRRYYTQITCLYKQLTGFFSRLESLGLLKNAQVIMHGDHGSRLIAAPTYLDALGDEPPIGNLHDLRDNGYATLMAVRRRFPEAGSPDVSPSYYDAKAVVKNFYENRKFVPMQSQQSLQVFMHRKSPKRIREGNNWIEPGMGTLSLPLNR